MTFDLRFRKPLAKTRRLASNDVLWHESTRPARLLHMCVCVVCVCVGGDVCVCVCVCVVCECVCVWCECVCGVCVGCVCVV